MPDPPPARCRLMAGGDDGDNSMGGRSSREVLSRLKEQAAGRVWPGRADKGHSRAWWRWPA